MLTKFGKLTVGKHVVSAKQRGPGEPIFPLIIFGIVILSSGVVSLWLWPETNKKQMTETIEEAEKDASTKNNWVKCCS